MLRTRFLLRVLIILSVFTLSFGTVSLADRKAAAADNTDFSLLSALDSKDTDDMILLLFAAAAGTDTETERAARKKLNAVKAQQRNEQNAAYRERTLPWLRECFADLLKKDNDTVQADNGSNASGAVSDDTVPEEAQKSGSIKAAVSNKAAKSTTVRHTMFLPDDDPAADVSVSEQPSKSTSISDSGSDSAEALKKSRLSDAFDAFNETETGKAYLAKMKSLGAEDAESALSLTRSFCADWLSKINAEVMAAANPDYECWIYCPDTMIDYPVMHGTDNTYYMSHLPDGSDNRYGSLFIDFRNLRGLQDPNTIVYGHHMKNGAMFKALSWYSEQAFYEAHPYMLMITPNMVYVLQIFAGRVADESDRSSDIALGDSQAILDYAQNAVNQSKFKTAVEVQPMDRLVTLSTCAYNTWDSRFLLTGRLLPCGDENITVVFSPYAEALDDSGGAWG